ncbi:MAG: hypothetical protein G5663_02970 [Serratia symbiotica]|nr:hypothetical protein [Serratia symbiotica]
MADRSRLYKHSVGAGGYRRYTVDGESGKINVTLPSLLIRRIDQFVPANPEYSSRSGLLSRVAADKMIRREKR